MSITVIAVTIPFERSPFEYPTNEIQWNDKSNKKKDVSRKFNIQSISIMLLQVAWFVSNCHPRNQRMHYAKELSKYIQVDIYGTCGSLRCPRSQSQACFDMLDEDYKFYLAFENSNCKDYITEKFFVNGLGYDTF